MNENNESKVRSFSKIWPVVTYFVGLGIGYLAPGHNLTSSTAIMQDINKDSIADIVTYDSNGKYLNTLIGVKDSSSTIHYVDARKVLEQEYNVMLEDARKTFDQKYKTNYNIFNPELKKDLDALRQKRDSILEQYKR